MLMEKGIAWLLEVFSLWIFKYKPLYIPTYTSIRGYPSMIKCVPEPQGGWHVGRVLRGSGSFLMSELCARGCWSNLSSVKSQFVHVISEAPVLF